MGFDAFISYSHAADGRLAPQVQVGLQRFAKPWWRRRALRVFRDETGLAANPHLWASIEEALGASEWFVFLASPEAAGSEWVGRELGWWLAHRDVSRVLPVVTGGDLVWDQVSGCLDVAASSAVPGVLAEAWVAEPRWVDLRWARDAGDVDLRDVRFRDVIADLAAPMHGVAKDELASEEVRQHRRTVRTVVGAGVALALFAVAAVAAGVFAVGQRDDARAQALVSQARAVAAQATANAPVRLDRALLLGAHAVQVHDDVDTRRGLLAALETAGSLEGFVPALNGQDAVVSTGRSGSVLTLDGDVLRRWDTSTWSLLAENDDLGIENIFEPTVAGEFLLLWGDGAGRLFRTDDLTPASPLLSEGWDRVAGVPGPFAFVVTHDGRRSVSIPDDGASLVVADIVTGREIERFAAGSFPLSDCGAVTTLALGSDDQLFLGCESKGFVYDLADLTGSPRVKVDVPFAAQYGWFGPDGSMLVLEGGVSEDPVLVDVGPGEILATIPSEGAPFGVWEFDDTGRYLAATVRDEEVTMSVWDLDDALGDGALLEPIGRLVGLGPFDFGHDFLPADTDEDGIRLLIQTWAGTGVWNLERETVIGEPIARSVIRPVIDAADGLVYVVAAPDPSAPLDQPAVFEVVSAADGSTVRRFEVDAVPVLDVFLSGDGERLLVESGRRPGSLQYTQVATRNGAVERAIGLSGLPEGDFWASDWSPDEQRVALLIDVSSDLAQSDVRLFVGDLETGEVREADRLEEPWSVGWTSAGEIVVGGYFDESVTFVDPDSGAITETLLLRDESGGRRNGVADLETGPDGLLVVADFESEVWIVDPVARRVVGDPYLSESGRVVQAAADPRGGVVAALDGTGAVLLWDRRTGRSMAPPLRGHPGSRTWDEIGFLADGTLITASAPVPEDWDVLSPLRYEVLRWRFDSDSLVATACRLAGRELTEEEWRTFVDPDGSPVPVCG